MASPTWGKRSPRAHHFLAFVLLAGAAAWASLPSLRITKPQPPFAHPNERPVPWTPPPAATPAPAYSNEGFPWSLNATCFDGKGHPVGIGATWMASDGCNWCLCDVVRDKVVAACTTKLCPKIDGAAPKPVAPEPRPHRSPGSVRPTSQDGSCNCMPGDPLCACQE